jgi:acetyl-CoA acetyltransferase
VSRREAALRGTAAIVGVAESNLGVVGPGVDSLDLVGQATVRALADGGLQKSDVDGLFCHSAFFNLPTVMAGEYLGIRPRYTDSTATGGSSFVGHLRHAAAAIEAGLCEVALIVYGSVSGYALAAARHMHEFGTTREQLAEVAVAARKWAQLNPAAFERGDLSIEDVLSSRMVSDPLTVRDCCLVTDGGGAVIVTSAERARSLRKAPAYILGVGDAHWQMHISQAQDVTRTAAIDSSARAYAAAGLTSRDVDVVELYDAFTINTILFLEDLGFCEKGEGGSFVANGNIAPGGGLPVNTNGGGLSYCHPGMYGIFVVIEAVRQLRGECGDRQVADVHVAMAHGNGGTLSSQVTALLGDESTL